MGTSCESCSGEEYTLPLFPLPYTWVKVIWSSQLGVSTIVHGSWTTGVETAHLSKYPTLASSFFSRHIPEPSNAKLLFFLVPQALSTLLAEQLLATVHSLLPLDQREGVGTFFRVTGALKLPRDTSYSGN